MSNVEHPEHYNAGAVECIDGIEAATESLSGFEGFCVGNAIKYLWRWKHKGGVEDLEKAKWYIDKLIERAKQRLYPTTLKCDALKSHTRAKPQEKFITAYLPPNTGTVCRFRRLRGSFDIGVISKWRTA